MKPKNKPLSYGALLETHKPRVIDSEREHSRQHRLIDKLMRRPARTVAEDRLLDLLATLVENYDAQHYVVPKSPPGRMLGFLLETRGVTQSKFAEGVGVSRQLITEIIKGRSTISPDNIRRFADYFDVAAELFVPSSQEVAA